MSELNINYKIKYQKYKKKYLNLKEQLGGKTSCKKEREVCTGTFYNYSCCEKSLTSELYHNAKTNQFWEIIYERGEMKRNEFLTKVKGINLEKTTTNGNWMVNDEKLIKFAPIIELINVNTKKKLYNWKRSYGDQQEIKKLIESKKNEGFKLVRQNTNIKEKLGCYDSGQRTNYGKDRVYGCFRKKDKPNIDY